LVAFGSNVVRAFGLFINVKPCQAELFRTGSKFLPDKVDEAQQGITRTPQNMLCRLAVNIPPALLLNNFES
jgi:hypothetical protein